MAGLISECEAFLEAETGPEVLDAALVAVAQRVEHYEIAVYGTARTFAEMLSEDEDARLLQLSLDECVEADEQLTEIAEDSVNADAEMAGED
jgi:ferritin-like metal-binding protein YciE